MRTALGLLALFAVLPATAADPAYKAGVARVNITPTEFIWMSGYASRKMPAEGKTHDLFAKALALEDAAGHRLVLVTTDLIGLTKELSDGVYAGVAKAANLKREQLLLNASHTHCGPVVGDNLLDMFDLTTAQKKPIADYAAKLKEQLIAVVLDAVKNLKPATLAFGQGEAAFAVNRRQKTEKGITLGVNREGPVDHGVPVLSVTAADGKLLAVAFGYACHNTTLSYFQWCGDYAGFAQIEVEKANPGTTAMFWIGCGADANPNPRGTEDLARRHGQELAAAVGKTLAGARKPITGGLAAGYEEIALDLDNSLTPEKLRADALSSTAAVRNRANRLVKEHADHGKLPLTYPRYPVQAWSVGDQITWVGLGGEVVLDYATRLRKELPAGRTLWVAGYCNDVMAYIPSKRVLAEGGYEADSSMVYYGLAGKWTEGTEDKIVGTVTALVKRLTETKP